MKVQNSETLDRQKEKEEARKHGGVVNLHRENNKKRVDTKKRSRRRDLLKEKRARKENIQYLHS
jgi:hypothetical protein